MEPEVEELVSRSRSLEDEILRLRRQITDACSMEQYLLNEKHVMERKLMDLRVAISYKQSDVVSENLKELTLKKDYIEENLRLCNQLKALEDENYTFTSSLLNLLTDYGIRPPLFDASCLSNFTMRLYHQLHQKLSGFHVPGARDLQKPQYHHDLNAEPTIIPSRVVIGDTSNDAADSRSPSQDILYPFQNSEGGDDLPGIVQFQITGDAKPGSTLRACGFPINGTVYCFFQWGHFLQDGTNHYVEGANNHDYVVTADDVDAILFVECIPLDDTRRQGEMVKHFANNQDPISCDEEMRSEINSYVYARKARFTVLLLVDSSEVWEVATLILKQSIFQIRLKHTHALVVEEKYSPDLLIKVSFGLSTQFAITSSNGTSYPLNTAQTSHRQTAEEDVRLREIIVLTMRIFQSKALDDARRPKA